MLDIVKRAFAATTSLGQALGRELLFIQLLAQLQSFDVIKEFDDFLVRAVAQGPQESRRQKFPPAFATIEINIKQISGIELHLDPGAAIGNDAETVKNLAVKVNARFESDARRAV